MITPSFLLTATERVLPRLALDWTTGLDQSGVDVTRAGVATFVGSNGLIQSATANTQRVDYATGTAGLLVEESRINSNLQSSSYNNASWSLTSISVTDNAYTSPDGTVNASKLLEAAATTYHYLSPAVAARVTPIASTAYTASVFLRYAERTYANVQFVMGGINTMASIDLSTGTVSSQSGSATVVITDYKDAWYRVSVTGTTSTTAAGGLYVYTANTATLNPTYLGDAAKGIYCYGFQIEAGAKATSYIPTTTTAVTRNADVAAMTGTNFSDWWNSLGGTITATGIRTIPSGFGRLFAISDGTNTNRIDYTTSTSTTGQPTIVAAGVTSCDLSPGGWVVNATSKIATSFQTNNFRTSKGAGNVVSDIIGNLPTVDRMYIGVGATGTASFLNGYVQKIAFYAPNLTSNELQAFSK